MGKKENQAKYRAANREKLKAYAKEYRIKAKLEALEIYGKQCAECGFSDYRALHIDHINADGWNERKAMGGQHNAGYNFYLKLKKRGWPDGYQTLCANCNFIKQFKKNGL